MLLTVSLKLLVDQHFYSPLFVSVSRATSLLVNGKETTR